MPSILVSIGKIKTFRFFLDFLSKSVFGLRRCWSINIRFITTRETTADTAATEVNKTGKSRCCVVPDDIIMVGLHGNDIWDYYCSRPSPIQYNSVHDCKDAMLHT